MDNDKLIHTLKVNCLKKLSKLGLSKKLEKKDLLKVMGAVHRHAMTDKMSDQEMVDEVNLRLDFEAVKKRGFHVWLTEKYYAELAEIENVRNKNKVLKKYIVFIDDMDGDVNYGTHNTLAAIKCALESGAENIAAKVIGEALCSENNREKLCPNCNELMTDYDPNTRQYCCFCCEGKK